MNESAHDVLKSLRVFGVLKIVYFYFFDLLPNELSLKKFLNLKCYTYTNDV